MWKVVTSEDFDEWFAGLDDAAKTEVIAKVDLLTLLGPALRRPHADTLKGSKYPNMKELRADTASAVYRIAFVFDPDRSAILLCAGGKTGVSQKRFYRQLLDRAEKLYAAHLSRLKSRKATKEK